MNVSSEWALPLSLCLPHPKQAVGFGEPLWQALSGFQMGEPVADWTWVPLHLTVDRSFQGETNTVKMRAGHLGRSQW